MIGVSLNVEGLVQGVGFRYFTKQKGQEIGISGTVKNLPNGSVQIELAGSNEDIQKMIKWLHIGPPTARVERLEYEFNNKSNGLIGFEIIR